MQDIDTRLLRSFIAVAAEQSVSMAAKRLGCSQGTMSLRIRKLEDQLGLRLFDRGRYNLKLTAAGRDLLPDAQALVDMHDRIFDHATVKLATGTVRLGMGEGCDFGLLPKLLRRVQDHYNGIDLSIQCEAGADLVASIQAKSVELAVVALPEQIASATVLARPRLQWVAAPDFPFERQKTIPLACFPDGCYFRTAGIAALESRDIAHRLALISPSEEAIHNAVRAGVGITIMAEGTVPGDLRAIVRPSVLPAIGSTCIQLLQGSNAMSDAAQAIRREIIGAYQGK